MRSRHVAAAFLVLLALWQIAQGLYIPAKAVVAQLLLRDAWGQTTEENDQVRPWPWADTWPIARLVATAHDVDLIVLAGVSGTTLAFGPGHMDGSALPGRSGQVVLSGHRDTHFRFLRHLKPGDELLLEMPDARLLRYVVRRSTVVDSSKDRLRLDGEGNSLLLVTCYPFDAIDPGGPLRYLVEALPV